MYTYKRSINYVYPPGIKDQKPRGSYCSRQPHDRGKGGGGYMEEELFSYVVCVCWLN
jgi:hypothetical protein